MSLPLHPEPHLGLVTVLLLVLAGVATGLVGYLTGLASLVSYPAMLLAGLPPVAANVTQTLGLTAIGVGSSLRSRHVLREGSRRDLGFQVLVAALAGGAGALTLLLAGEESFVVVVPWLVLLAALAVVAKPALLRWGAGQHRPRLYAVLLAAVCFYGGYFGAGAGTMYLAVALLATADGFGRSMVLKSALLAVTNAVSALIFIGLGPVHWVAALALGAGCLVGGSLAPIVQGWCSEEVLRVVVGVAGVGLALWLWLG